MGGIPWTKEEDELLRKCIEKYGEGKWHRVPFLAGLNRCRKSCRLRWLNYLRPDIKRGTFAEDEVDLIIKLHKLLGNRWSLVAARLPGRTGNDVKNYWNCHLSKRLNAQETDLQEKHYARNNVQVMRPQPSINSAAGRSSKTKPSTSWQLPAVVVQEESSSTSMAMLCNIEDGQSTHQMFETDQYNKNNVVPCVDDQERSIMGDLAMDLQFEQVTDQYHDQEVNNEWDWDDSILDVDLWTDS